MRNLSAGRFAAHCWGQKDGDFVSLTQTHANGSDVIVGEMSIRGEEINDIIYVLTQAREQCRRELGRYADKDGV